ncbi:MAG: hypothetical protein ACYTHK_02720 [Planctomycetota bacterium]|jgi:tetratricopeptide (TPR) repeat protein
MSLARWSLLLLAACAAPPPPAEEPEPPTPRDPVLADVEADRILAEKYYELAVRLRARSEMLEARDAIRKARALLPDEEKYRRLEFSIEVEMGDRAATVALIANEAVAAAEVKREEELVTVRKLIAEAKRLAGLERWEQAKRAYERAWFILEHSKYREDADFEALRRSIREEELAR